MKRARLLWAVIKRVRFDKILAGFLCGFFAAALIIMLVEPGIKGYGNALWYTFVACTSIGFGDIVAVTAIGRLVTVLITLYEVVLVALFSGVVVSYYLEVVHRREKFTATVFLDKMEHLTELSPEELKEMQDKAREFSKKI
ncbi:MAG: two pore domain potassium channel family protein [Mogibacterium sp.]|nr:two pore domain potassium channel family protein [Mogibacterium sp.]